MSGFCTFHRFPRARVDPIDTEVVALSMISMLMTRPPRHETIVVPLDDQRRGLSAFVVAGTTSPDSLYDVVDVVGRCAAITDEISAVVVATVRPDAGVDEGDVDRWLGASALLDEHGVELVEWFVVGDVVRCPRDLLGERPRWRS